MKPIVATITLIFLLTAALSLHAAPATNLPRGNVTIYPPLVMRNHSDGPTLAGCPVFPPDNVWNARVDTLPVDARSDTYINFIGSDTGVHPDFGSGTWDGGPIGIPHNLVPGTQPLVPIIFDYADESDAGPYPIPSNPKIEWGSDHHLLIVDTGHCVLYETWDTRYGGGWQAQ